MAAASPEATTPAPRAAARPAAREIAALIAVALLGALHLPYPFEWDQATFLTGAKVLAHGGTLYRDWWDVKQPAIYAFYVAAGRAFGFSESGVHALELLWMLALACAVTLALRARKPQAAWLAPLLTVGIYWAAVGPWHLTQVEGLVGLPLWLATWWGSLAADGRSPWRALLAGLSGAVVLLFKLALAPVVALVWLVALVHAATRARAPAGRIAAGFVLPALAGLAVPLALVIAHEARLGLLPTLRWTTFTYPGYLLSQVRGTRVNALFDGVSWFALRWAPVLALAAAGAAEAWRARDRLGLCLMAWIGSGAAVVLAQRTSWWQYHWLLLDVPLGVLAALGASALWQALPDSRGARRLAGGFAAMLFLAPGVLTLEKLTLLARDRLALGAAHARIHQERVSELYSRVDAEVQFLASAGARPGPLFVIDDPVYYLRSGRAAVAALRGVRFYPYMRAAEWDSLGRQLRADPPAYVLVESEFAPLVDDSAAAAPVRALLARDYRPLRRDARGEWWERAR